jgi:hypothetical protein
MIDSALMREAIGVMAESQQVVPELDGDLGESGEIIVEKIGSGGIIGVGGALTGIAHRIFLSYGRTKAQDYAQAVHEHPSYHSPPSWQGKVINWTKPGTGPKFLERPLRQRQRGMAGRISRLIRAELGLAINAPLGT